MPDSIAGERDAGHRVTEGDLSLGGPIHTHSGVPRQVFDDSPETTKLVRHYDPALPTDELYAPPGEETVS